MIGDGAGDINGDGYVDLLVGFSEDNTNGYGSGAVKVFSGLDGSLLYYLRGEASSMDFGDSVSGVGDVNGDGINDFIVGAPGSDIAGTL